MLKSSFFFLSYFLFVLNCFAQPATIDSSFNKAGDIPGIFETRFYGKQEDASMIVAQKDEKIVMVGGSLNGINGHDFTFVRINPDGTLDESFASKGRGTYTIADSTDDIPETVAIDNAGRIWIGGSYKSASGISKPVIIRLTANGIIDKTFGKDGKLFPDLTSKQMTSIHTLKIQGDKILAVGSYQDSISTFIVGATTVVFRLNGDGSLDRTFGNKGLTILKGVGCYQIALNENNIALGGTYPMPLKTSSLTTYAVAMLKSEGAIDTGFGDNGFFKGTAVAQEYLTDLAFQKDGKLVTVGHVRDQSVIMSISSAGKIDSSFASTGRLINLTGYMEEGKSIFVLPNGNILATIETSYSEAGVTSRRLRLVKLNEKGQTGSFGYDQISSFATTLGNAVLTSDYNLITARATGNDFSVIKVKTKVTQGIRFNNLPELSITSGSILMDAVSSLKVPVLFKSGNAKVAEIKGDVLAITGPGKVVITAYVDTGIDYEGAFANQNIEISAVPSEFLVGKNYTGTKKVQTYWVIPYNEKYTYEWSYSGENAYFISNAEKDSLNKLNVFFPEDAVGGILTCKSYDRQGVLRSVVSKEIEIVPGASDGNVKESLCPKNFAPCYATYINSFNLNTLSSSETGCRGTGYTDFTESGISTELFLGDVYKAELEIGALTKTKRYIGIWIDYNNDGSFDGDDEFVNASFGDDTLLTIKPLIIKNVKEYAGDRRLRVRCRTNGSFSSTDACILSGEAGETEDYIIRLKVQDALEAPEIITPNDDGKNDYFVIRGVNEKSDNKLQIFDKWGDIKFTKENYVNDWTGKSDKGDQVAEGTYYYVFKNGSNVIKGFVEVKY